MLDEKLSVGMSDAEIRDLIAVIDQKQKGCIEFSAGESDENLRVSISTAFAALVS